ncbi:MAG: hypothetical protein ABI548_27475 [Polyangiaceae bacterium]
MTSPAEPPVPTGARQVQADGAVVFVGPRLAFRVAALRAGVVLVTARGSADTPGDTVAELAMHAELDRELERAGSLTVFADVRESSRMPAASRELTAKWLKRHQARVHPCHVLVRSKLMEMAVSILTMLVGGGMLKLHSKPDTFLEAMRKAGVKLAALPTIEA